MVDIAELRLKTINLAAQRALYADVLGVPVLEDRDDCFTLDCGRTRLVFEAGPQQNIHHIAINIPQHQFEQALAYTAARVDLLPHEGRNFIDFSSSTWNAHSLYFEDAGGNITEFIARHRIDSPDAPETFSGASLLGVSEIGFATDDVAGLGRALRERLKVPLFDGNPDSDSFMALGDDHGLLIIVQTGRNWLPTNDHPCGPHPITLMLRGDAPTTFEHGPYRFRVVVG